MSAEVDLRMLEGSELEGRVEDFAHTVACKLVSLTALRTAES